jgi:hypothetical protein
MASPTLLFVIVGRNEPLYEAEFNKKPGAQDAATRQNYFVLHSALDLVEKAAWTTNSMYLKVVDKVCSESSLLGGTWWCAAFLVVLEMNTFKAGRKCFSQRVFRLIPSPGEPSTSLHLFDRRERQAHAPSHRKE